MTREQPVPPTPQTRSLSDVDRAHARLLASAQAESRIRNLALFWSAVGAGLGARRA